MSKTITPAETRAMMTFDDERDDANHAADEAARAAAGQHDCAACGELCDCGEAAGGCCECGGCWRAAAKQERIDAGPLWDTWEEYRSER